jgi:large subunit ribosomal protein L25
MAEVRISAEPRTEFGKGAARRTRRANLVPAVLYGHGGEPQHISLPNQELMRALKTKNVLLSLDIAGKTQLAVAKDVQRDPVRNTIEHVDLIVVRSGEKITIDLLVTVGGSPAPDGLLVINTQIISVEAEATHLPSPIEIDVDGLAVGGQILAGDVKLPAGTTLVTDPETVIAHVAGQLTAEQADAELAAAESEAGIVHEAPTAATTDSVEEAR